MAAYDDGIGKATDSTCRNTNKNKGNNDNVALYNNPISGARLKIQETLSSNRPKSDDSDFDGNQYFMMAR